MAEPYNYMSGFAGLQSPSDAFIAGIKNGAGIQQIQAERAAYDLKQQQAAQMQADLAALSKNPTTSGIAAMSIKYPQLSEGFKRSYDMLEPAKKQAKLESATQIYAAMENGRSDLAKDILKRQADAARNSGDEQEARAAEAHMQLIDTNPNLFKMSAGKLLASAVGPEKFAETFAKIGDEQRAGELQGDLVRKGAADATEAESDASLKNLGIVAQKAGALAKPGVKPSQAITMFKSLEASGVIPKGGAQEYIDSMPADAKALPGYLRQVQASGMTANEQRKFTDVDANTAATNATSRANTRDNNRTQLEVQDRIATRQAANAQFKVEHGVAGLTDEQNEALFGENGAVTTGRLDPKRINSKTASIFADAELKKPGTNFSQISSDIGKEAKANTEFATGKAGNTIRSFNVGIAHLDTLSQLADAMHSNDVQAINRVSNYWATQTGKPAPTNFEAAKKIVGDEIVKSIVGGQNAVADREEAAKIIDAAKGPEQLSGAIRTVQELMVGQLGGLRHQYKASTGRDDFNKYLVPRALEIESSHGGGKGHGPAPAASGQVIDFGSLR